MAKRIITKDYRGEQVWEEVSMQEWDKLPNSEREITIGSEGIRFVKRVPLTK